MAMIFARFAYGAKIKRMGAIANATAAKRFASVIIAKGFQVGFGEV